MEEESQEKSTNGKLINLNAPLLSTRRTNNICTDRLTDDPTNARERIPFSWEQTPGKPRNAVDFVNDDFGGFLPPPRPPPGRRDYDVVNDHDDGCDGDADDEDDNVLDIFSLADSLETNESSAPSVEEEIGCGGAVTAVEMVSPSTNFMIQRFLPDAKALAAASSSAVTNIYDCNYNVLYPSNHGCSVDGGGSSGSRAVSLRQTASPFSTSKGSAGCGFDIFLPWRVKTKAGCGGEKPCRANIQVIGVVLCNLFCV